MSISVFDLFTIGIGPSSSHTIGPMRAGKRFIDSLQLVDGISSVARIEVNLYGSLGATGKGHGSDKAVLLGLEGNLPESVDVDAVARRIESIRATGRIKLEGQYEIAFDEASDLIMHREQTLEHHSNGMTFSALDSNGKQILVKTYYSVGGGFVVNEEAIGRDRIVEDTQVLPYPFSSADQLLALCKKTGMSISDLMLENEKVGVAKNRYAQVCLKFGMSCKLVYDVVVSKKVFYLVA